MPRFVLLVRTTILIFVVVIVAPRVLAGAAGAEASRTTAALSACTIGETNAANVTLNTLDLTDLNVYQLLDPAECAACSGGAAVINQVSWRFRYFQGAQCPLQFEIWIVGTDGAACPRPDTTRVFCGPVYYVFAPAGATSPIVTIPLPAGCCITSRAFVRWRVVDTGGCGVGQLAFFAYAPGFAIPCRSYASSPLFPLDDSTNNLGMYPTITADADCCAPTPVHRQSWGRTKTIYR